MGQCGGIRGSEGQVCCEGWWRWSFAKSALSDQLSLLEWIPHTDTSPPTSSPLPAANNLCFNMDVASWFLQPKFTIRSKWSQHPSTSDLLSTWYFSFAHMHFPKKGKYDSPHGLHNSATFHSIPCWKSSCCFSTFKQPVRATQLTQEMWTKMIG